MRTWVIDDDTSLSIIQERECCEGDDSLYVEVAINQEDA